MQDHGVIGEPVSRKTWEKYGPLYEQVGKSAEVGFFPGENGATRFVVVADKPEVFECAGHPVSQRLNNLAKKFRIQLDVREVRDKLVISSTGYVPDNQQILDEFFQRMKKMLDVDELRLSGDAQHYC